MKTKLIIIGFLLITSQSFAQESRDYLNKVQTLDATINTLYSVISGDKGEARNWELFKFLFKPDEKLIPSGRNQNNIHDVRFMTPQDYISTSGKWLLENGFHEKELHRTVEAFGNIVQVFSSYESFKS